MVDKMRARTNAEGNVVGILWPSSKNEYLFIYDFRDDRHYSNWQSHDKKMSKNQAKVLNDLLNSSSDNPLLIAP